MPKDICRGVMKDHHGQVILQGNVTIITTISVITEMGHLQIQPVLGKIRTSFPVMMTLKNDTRRTIRRTVGSLQKQEITQVRALIMLPLTARVEQDLRIKGKDKVGWMPSEHFSYNCSHLAVLMNYLNLCRNVMGKHLPEWGLMYITNYNVSIRFWQVSKTVL